jgi:hypothetical protein
MATARPAKRLMTVEQHLPSRTRLELQSGSPPSDDDTFRYDAGAQA